VWRIKKSAKKLTLFKKEKRGSGCFAVAANATIGMVTRS